VGGGWQSCCSWSEIPWWKIKWERVHCRDATASSVVSRVRGEILAYCQAVAVKRYSSMRNWLFGLPGRIICEQSPCCKRKWLECSWICSSTVSPLFGLGWVLLRTLV
jgi:hypothetical protein